MASASNVGRNVEPLVRTPPVVDEGAARCNPPDLERADPVRRPSNASAAWLARIDPAKRAQLGALHEVDVKWSSVSLFFPLLWAVTGVLVLYLPYWPVRIAGYVVMGVAIHAMAVLTHEASHYSMFRNPRWDRWVGFLMGAPVLVSHTAYRVLHAYHHRYTRDEGDPDEFHNATKNRILLSLLFYAWLVIGTPIYLVHVPAFALKHGRWRDRLDILLEYALLVLLFGTAFGLAHAYGRWDMVLHCWAMPMCVGMVFGNVRSWSEHSMTIPGHPFTQTRTVTSNKLVSFLMCNLNYHLEHHLCPAIPWYNLPRMHALMLDEYRQAGSFVYRSYLRFLWDAFRTGVHGIAHMPGF